MKKSKKVLIIMKVDMTRKTSPIFMAATLREALG
jgi:hypothetical protein